LKKVVLISILVVVVRLAVGVLVHAQQPTKAPRIGFLDGSTASGSAVLVEAFRQELLKIGWIEGEYYHRVSVC